MHNSQKRCSPLTRPVGPDKVNRSVTITLGVDSLLAKVAYELGESVNEFIRGAIALRASTFQTPTAFALKAAMNANTRQIFSAVACLTLVLFVEANVWRGKDQDEFRRGRSNKGRVARVIRTACGREMEFSA